MSNRLLSVIPKLFLLFLLLEVIPAAGQSRRQAVPKDTLRLGCLLNDYAFVRKEKPAIDMGQEEPSLTISSSTDTLVRAPVDLVISTVRRIENGRYEVVAYHQDYFLWITGIATTAVRKNQKIRKGDTLGMLPAGSPLELLLYDFETPVDPAPFLDCKPVE